MFLNLVIWLLVFGVSAIAGPILLFRGWRGRVIDTMPHCRTCEYNLTDLVSHVCPECGTAITPQQIMHGLRRRRLVLMAIGLGLLAVAGLLGFNLFKAVAGPNRYVYYPLSWILPDAQNGVPFAVWELGARLQANRLTDADMRRIVPLVLAAQQRRSFPGRFNEVVNLVGFLDAAGRLTKDEQARFYDQLLDCPLRCRRKLRLGDPIPIDITARLYGPASIFTKIRVLEETLDGQAAGQAVGDPPMMISWVGGAGHGETLGSSGLALGRHTIQVKVSVEWYRLRSADFEPYLNLRWRRSLIFQPEWRERLTELANTLKPYMTDPTLVPFRTETLMRTAEFEILPVDGPHPVGLIDDPAMKARLQQAITINGVELLPLNTEGRAMVITELVCGASNKGPALPVDVGFRVILKTADREIEAGKMCSSKGAVNSYMSPHESVAPFEDEEVLVILRSSPDAALGSAAIDAIWNGELTYGPISVTRDPLNKKPGRRPSPATRPEPPPPAAGPASP